VRIASVADLQDFVGRLPDRSEDVRLTIESLDLLRVLTLAEGNDPTTQRLRLRVTDWERPNSRWTGVPGPVHSVRRWSVSYPTGQLGAAEVDIEFGMDMPLSAIARGVYPLLGVARRHHGYGFPDIGTASAPAAALALLPTRTAIGIPELSTDQLDGVGLSRADIGLVGTVEALEEYTESAQDPARTLLQQPLLVEPSGHLAVTDRTELPLLDLNVHNPIGRVQSFVKPPGSITLHTSGGRLHFTAPEDSEHLPTWSQPDDVPLSSLRVRGLRRTEAIDLSGVAVADRSAELRLYRRLAELAATGAILHSLPEHLSLAPAILGESLATSLRAPYRTTSGLLRDLRSVPQRRDAMTRFGGFFELAGQLQQMGHRLLPSVSLVMSSMRPQRSAPVLRSLAAQRYPHVEIVVGVHGNEDSTGEFDDVAKESGASVVRYDRSVPFGSVLADTARRAGGDLIIKVDDDDVYGPDFVGDLVLAYLYSNADVVGKTTEYLFLEDMQRTVHRTFAVEEYRLQLAGGAMLLSQAMLNEIGGWRPSHNSTDRSVLIRIGNCGGMGYRTQSLGYVYVRHSDGHTWARNESLLVKNAFEQWSGFIPQLVDA
jgi:hypothetical protein